MRRSVRRPGSRAGGPAEVLFRPADVEDLAAFLAALPSDVPVTVLGVGSNILVRDGGVKGVVIRLLRGFTGIAVEGHEVVAGAGAPDLNVALTARDHALAGLEFLSGIPGTIGGALRMNAGAYEGDLSQVLISAQAVDRAGKIHTVPTAAMRFSYRHSEAPADWIFTSARAARDAGRPARHRPPHRRDRRARAPTPSRAAAPAARPSSIRPGTRPGSWSIRPAAAACASARPRSPRSTATS